MNRRRTQSHVTVPRKTQLEKVAITKHWLKTFLLTPDQCYHHLLTISNLLHLLRVPTLVAFFNNSTPNSVPFTPTSAFGVRVWTDAVAFFWHTGQQSTFELQRLTADFCQSFCNQFLLKWISVFGARKIVSPPIRFKRIFPDSRVRMWSWSWITEGSEVNFIPFSSRSRMASCLNDICTCPPPENCAIAV